MTANNPLLDRINDSSLAFNDKLKQFDETNLKLVNESETFELLKNNSINSLNYHLFENYNPAPLNTGIFEFKDSITEDDFTVIAGSTGSGKSTVGLFIACSIAKSGKRVLFINTENSNSHLIKQIKSLGFDYFNDFGQADIHGNNNLIIHCFDYDISCDFKTLLNLRQSLNPDVIFIDLFSSLLDKVPFKDRFDFTNNYAEKLSFFKKKYNCTVFVTEQLVKNNTRFGRPVIDDIQGGAALGRKASKIIMVYRHIRAAHDHLGNKPIPLIANVVTELLVRKDRYGLIFGKYLVKYNFGYKQLSTLDEIEYNDFLKNCKK